MEFGLWNLNVWASLQLLQEPSLCLWENDLTSLGLSLLIYGDHFFIHAKSIYGLFTMYLVLFQALELQ